MRHSTIAALVLLLSSPSCSVTNDLEVDLPRGAHLMLEYVSFDLPSWQLATPDDVGRAQSHEAEWIGFIASGFWHRVDELGVRHGGTDEVRVRIVVTDFDSGTRGAKYHTALKTGTGVLKTSVVVPAHGFVHFEKVFLGEFRPELLEELGAEVAVEIAKLVGRA